MRHACCHRRKDDYYRVNLDVHFAAGLEAGELEQGTIEDDAVGIADFRNRF